MIGPFTLVRFFNRAIGYCHNKRIAMIGPFTLVGFFNTGIGCFLNKRIAMIGSFTLVGFFNRAIGCCHNKRLITTIGPFTLVRFFNRGIGCCHNNRIAMIGPFALVGLYKSHGSLSYNIIPLYIFGVFINKVLEGFDDNNNIWIGSPNERNGSLPMANKAISSNQWPFSNAFSLQCSPSQNQVRV
jgi:hypothetical protein